MIKSIEIQNYQSHKETKLEFSPGVNVIVGATDSGKSAIIKALRWVITNRPTGDSFRSSWGGDTEVKVETIGEYLYDVTRAKTDKGNLYKLNDLEFKAFGSDVPEEIKKALDMNHINVQTQFESHFLLSESAGAVATHFNKVAHLDKIDVGLQNIQRWLRKSQQDIVYNESQVEELTEQLVEYNSLEEIEELIVRLEQIETEVEWANKKTRKVMELRLDIESVDVYIKQSEKIVSKGVLVEKALGIIEEQKVVETLITRLDKGVRMITEVEESIKELEELQPFEKMVNRALEIDKEIREVGVLKFQTLVGRLERNTEVSEELQKSLQKMEKEFTNNMEVCPLCETVLK